MKEPTELEKFIKEVEKFVKELLSSYNYKLVPKRNKAIHDPVWGTQVLSPCEVAFLDSPLIQRLRYIHQNALAFYTYPSAIHTRFEHTLGVLSAATRMAQRLNDKKLGSVTNEELKAIRVAAIFHDCGHGIFSHVSESLYLNKKWFRELIHKDEYAQSENKPHEILGFFILKSEQFLNFYKNVTSTYDSDLHSIDPKDIADLILGRPFNGKILLGQIINGVFDADKIDYISRDSYFTGIPMTVDVERLFYSIDVDKESNFQICISPSGATAIEEILLNKISLFGRLYHHPKVRAADAMMHNFIQYIRDNQGILLDPSIKLELPLDFLRYSDFDFLNPFMHKDVYLKRIVNDFRNRKLLKKALVISSKTVNNQDNIYNLQGVRNQENWNSIKSDIQSQIYDELPSELKKNTTKHDIVFDVPKPPKLNEANKLYVRLTKNDKPKILSDVFPLAKQWLNAYITNKWRAHIFCPIEPDGIRDQVYKIAKVLLDDKNSLDLELNDYSYSFAKIDE